MENERSAEEKKEIVIPCEHLPWDDWKFAKRVVLFHVGYVELERVIDCQSKSTSCTTYRERRSSTDDCHMEQDTCNPVDCQECKANILHYLTNAISHPHPARVMADLCTRFYDFLHHDTPSPEVIPYCFWARVADKEDLRPTWELTTLPYLRTRATDMCLTKLSYLCGETCLETDTNLFTKEYHPVVEDVSYEIRNYIERHCLSQCGNDNREWCVSWVGIQTPRPNHPQLCNLNLTKVDQGDDVLMAFTCPICFQGQDEKLRDSTKEAGVKRKRVNDYSTSINKNKNKKKRSKIVHMEDDIVKLPCQHVYHESCINQWLHVFVALHVLHAVSSCLRHPFVMLGVPIKSQA